jgi:hypothetical protein
MDEVKRIYITTVDMPGDEKKEVHPLLNIVFDGLTLSQGITQHVYHRLKELYK